MKTVVWMILMLIGFAGPASAQQNPTAVDGLLDLSDWIFATDGSIDLRGQWEFYPGELLDHDHFQSQAPLNRYISVPGNWNDNQDSPISEDGVATFRLNVLTSGPVPMGLKLLSIGTAYKLSINGAVLAEVGKIGTSIETTTPEYLPQVLRFTPDSNQIEIIIQVANFHHRNAGLWEVIRLGTDNAMIAERNNRLAMDLLLFGAILMTALYNISLWLSLRNFTSGLYLGVFCLMVGARVLLVDERYISQIAPALSWDVLTRIEYITWFLTVPVFVGFLRSLFPLATNELVVRSFWILGIAAVALGSLLPIKLATELVPIYQTVTFAAIFYGSYAVLRAALSRTEGSILLGIGCLVMGLSVTNDILINNAWHSGTLLLHVGSFVFILLQSFLVSRRFAHAFQTIDRQSSELQKTTIEVHTQAKLRKAAERESRALSVEARRTDKLKSLSMIAHGVLERSSTRDQAALFKDLLHRLIATTHELPNQSPPLEVDQFFAALVKDHADSNILINVESSGAVFHCSEIFLDELLTKLISYAITEQPAGAQARLIGKRVAQEYEPMLESLSASTFLQLSVEDDGHWINHEHIMFATHMVQDKELKPFPDPKYDLGTVIAMTEEVGGIADFQVDSSRTRILFYLPVDMAGE